jgi:hypothetical protein
MSQQEAQNIKVVLRCRPMTSNEASKEKAAIKCVGDKHVEVNYGAMGRMCSLSRSLSLSVSLFLSLLSLSLARALSLARSLYTYIRAKGTSRSTTAQWATSAQKGSIQ